MFCPICKTEYRIGFTRCSDCDVPLVDSVENVRPATGDAPPKPELLWTGTDPTVSDMIKAALDDAEIPYHETSRDFGLIPGLSPPVTAFFVPSRVAEEARAVLKEVQSRYESGDTAQLEMIPDRSVPPEEDDAAEGDEPAAPAPDDIPRHFDPEEATADIWSGSDLAVKDMVIACLRENEIGSTLDDSNGMPRILVMPADEARAREIVREIADAAPPE